MKELKRLKLTKLSLEDLAEKQMDALRGGYNCGCGCHYAFDEGSSKADNYNANRAGGKDSYGGNKVCGSGTSVPQGQTTHGQ